jgi:carbamoyltransferase
MTRQLCITLGHNSSCILLNNGEVIYGFENERLSKIKSDSQFPELAIEKCLCYCTPDNIDKIYISHWSVDGKLSSMSAKHYNSFYLHLTFRNAVIHTLTKDFTHHDAHYWSAKCFAKGFKEENVFGIVADGFGNFGETISIYYEDNLIKRVFGFGTSLGLFYQYATAFLGLKMNQDEYKLLGYGAHIFNHITQKEFEELNKETDKWTHKFLKDIFSLLPNIKYDPLCSIDSLPALRLKYQERFDKVLSVFRHDISLETRRVIISYFVQTIVEKVILEIIKKYNMKNIILSGGLFLNVKLNNEILKVSNNICIMPLCGDQGAALGIYYKHYPELEINNLYWGTRSIDKKELNSEIIVLPNDLKTINLEVSKLLRFGYILNIIHGSMEFGPRALCNTSTITIPTNENVKYINFVNRRSTIMPMAPVITNPFRYFHSKDIKKIHKSLDYMITAINYDIKISKTVDFAGVSHADSSGVTGRPQVIKKNHILYGVINEFGILINTSFNIHGTPIVYDVNDINKAYTEQRKFDYGNKIKTIFITEEVICLNE